MANGLIGAPFIQGFIQMAQDGWEQGWHERNGGNLSYRMTKKEVKRARSSFEPGPWEPIGIAVPSLAKECFLVTAAGSYFRHIADSPKCCLGIIQVDGTGERYRVCWGFAGGGHPTSELSAHLMNHEVKKRVTNGKNRIIYHAHPANIIALTFVLPQNGYDLTRELWRMISECAIVFPEGVGVVEWMVPGSYEIAQASAREMEHHNVVVWAHHGLFCAGASFDETFGLMHTVEKAAEILVKVMSMHADRRRFITDEDLKALAEAYGLELSE